MTDKVSKDNLNKTIASGALVNILGAIGKAMVPLFFIMIARLYGTAIMGTFVIIYSMIDIAVSLTVSGINDGVQMFASRFHDDEERGEDDLYKIIANGFVLSFFLALAIIGFMHLGGTAFLSKKYSQPGVIESVQLLVWSIPFVIIPIIVVATTKALIIMKWDALILGFFKPFFLTVSALILYFFDPSLKSLLYSYMISSVLLTIISLVVFAKHFSCYKLFKSLKKFKLSVPLITFAIPQNLNMTFNTFITNLDVIMLGYFGTNPELVGFYAMGAQIVRNIRQIKLAFSGVYAPVIARLHKRGDRDGMNYSFSMVSRWTSTIAFPVALVVMLFREELIRIFHDSYTFDTSFMLLILVPPLLNCALGLSGNILVMTGHSLWNLLNSLTVTILNGALNYYLIPRYGLIGAAAATAIAGSIVTIMEVIEVYKLIGTHVLFKKIFKPYIAIIPGTVIALFTYSIWGAQATHVKAVASTLGVGIFVILLRLLKMEEEDKKTFMPWRYRKVKAV